MEYTFTTEYKYEAGGIDYWDSNTIYFDYAVTITTQDLIDYLLGQMKKMPKYEHLKEMTPEQKTWFNIGFETAIEMMDTFEFIDEDNTCDDDDLRQFVIDDREDDAISWYEENHGED